MNGQIDALMSDRITSFREAAQGRGKLEFDSHEAYTGEPEGRGHK